MAKPTLDRTGAPKTGDLFSSDAELRIPRRFDLHGRVHGNPIRRLAFSEHVRRCKVSAFSKGKTVGFVATDGQGRSTFISPKATSVMPSDDVLLIPSASSLAEIRTGLDS